MASQIEDLTHSDYDEVVALMRKYLAHTSERWERLYAWRFKDNPWAQGAPLGKCVRINGRIASYQYMTPWPMWIECESIIGYCSFDMLTDPTYRGKGVGRGVYQAVLDYSKQAPLLGTTANEVTGAVWIRRGAVSAPEADRSLYRILSPVRVAIAGGLRRLRAKDEKVPVVPTRVALSDSRIEVGGQNFRSAARTEHVEDLERTWSRMKPVLSFGTERSSEYLAWRYAQVGARPWLFAIYNSDSSDPAAWYSLWFRKSRTEFGLCTCWLADLVADISNEAMIKAIIDDAVRRARLGGAHIFEVRGMHLAIRDACRELGFRERQLPIASFLLNLPASRRPAVADWHVVAADADAILR